MRIPESNVTMSGVVRWVLGLATFVFAGAGFVLDRNPQLFVAAGACATMWWAWDFLIEFVFKPIEAFAHHLLQGARPRVARLFPVCHSTTRSACSRTILRTQRR